MKPIVTVIAVSLAAVSIARGATQIPARDAPAAVPVAGTGVIAGVVMTADADARPLWPAKVTLTNSSLSRQPFAMTDDQGRFAFTGLPAGRFTITASRPGFMTTEYGSKRVGGSGLPVTIADGERAEITVKIPRGAVIAGTVRGPDGEPAANVAMQLYMYDYSQSGERTLTPRAFSNPLNGSLTTDDRGMYRLYGLRPGEYYVAAQPRLSPLGGAVASAAEIEWAQRLIASPGSPPPAPPQSGASVALAPILYPGAADFASAVPVTVAAGEERTGIDFAIAVVPTATVSGTIVDADGVAPKLSQISLVRPGMPFGFGGGSPFIRPDADGHFLSAGVVPGDYVMAARGSAHNAEATAAVGPGGEASLPYWALIDLHVAGRDIDGVNLRLAPGASVSGRVVFDGQARPPADLTTVTVSVSPVQTTGSVSMASPPARANADGKFAVQGLGPGRYRVLANLPSTGTPVWTLASSMVGGVDVIDTPLEISGNDVSNGVITFTDRPTELSGSLLDQSGRPAPQYFILVASTDQSFWTPLSRRIRAVRPGTTGTFRITGLPPGEYYVLAADDLEQNRIYTAEYLNPLVANAIKLTLEAGEKKTQDFKIAGLAAAHEQGRRP